MVGGRGGSEWAAWLRNAMERTGATAADIEKRSGGEITRATVSKWLNGHVVRVSARPALTVARVLGQDRLEALHAAGHDVLVEEIKEIVAGTYEDAREPARDEDASPEPTAADLLKEVQQVGGQVAEVMALLVEGLAAGKSLGEALSDLAHRQQAELDAVKDEAGVTDRALRGHIDDPRAHEYPDSDY